MPNGVRSFQTRAFWAALAFCLACAGTIHADGPYNRPPPTISTPNNPTPPPPFSSPRELYDHIKKDLGLESDPSGKPQDLPSDDDLKKRVQELLKEYQNSKDAQRKNELKKIIKDAELNREARKHQDNANDYLLRRKAFIADVVDALLTISVVNQTKDLRSIFRCNLDQMRTEFLDILKELPAKEVMPYLWQKVEEQVKFSGTAAQARVTQFDAQKEELKERLRGVRMKINEKPAEPEKSRLAAEDEQLNAQIDQVEFDRMIAQAAVNNRNAKFIATADDFLVAYGAELLEILVPAMYGPAAVVRDHAAGLIRRVGLPAVPKIIQACEKTPNDELYGLLAAFSGKNLGRDLKAWRDWWASIEDKVKAQGPKADPVKVVEGKKQANPEQPVPPPNAPNQANPPAQPAKPDPAAAKTEDGLTVKTRANPETNAKAPEEKDDDWMKKLKEELQSLRTASEKLRTARQHHAEAMLMSNALERQLEALTKKKAETKEGDTTEADLRKALAEALKVEYSAKVEVDKYQAELDALRKKVQESDNK